MEIVITRPILQGYRLKKATPFSFGYDEADYETVPTPVSFPVLAPKNGLRDLLYLLRKVPPVPWEKFELLLKAETLATYQPDDLMVLRHLNERWQAAGLVLYPHQVETARKVIWGMNGHAILADEVGLGKTIEAGMILKEYMLRRLVHRALILVPASLCRQWEAELREKFGIPVWVVRHELDWERPGCLLASLDTAKKSPHAKKIMAQTYDLLIVDEAHRLKNRKTQNWHLVNSIKKRYFLMLTATPVQNDMKELYSLIDLLRPGWLGTYRQFQAKYMRGKRDVAHPDELRSLLSGVMVRNHRREVEIQIPPRTFHPVPVELSTGEDDLYKGVSQFVRQMYHNFLVGQRGSLPLVMLQREVCSSPWAVAQTLSNLSKEGHTERFPALKELFQLALGITESSKAKVVENLLDGSQEQWLIFTEFRATQAYLCQRLRDKGFKVLAFDGSLSPSKKEWVRWLFQRQAQVLVCTEAGGEGLNFQFCRNIINFDLPWNPMRLEQRIGRVHRLGQTQEVRVYNLATRNTIEEHILRLLFEKLRLFQTLIGDVESMFGTGVMDGSWEARIMDLFTGAESEDDLAQRFDHLAEEWKETVNVEKRGDAWWTML